MNLKTNLSKVFKAGDQCAMGEITTDEFLKVCKEEDF